MNHSSLSPLDSTVRIFSDFFSPKMLSEFNSDEKNQRQCPGETCMSVCAVWRGEAEGHMCTPPPHESSFLAVYLAVTLQTLWPL